MAAAETAAERCSDGVNRMVEWLAITLFVVMVFSAVTQVFTRYVLNYSFSWTEELSRYTFIWLNLLGASICIKRGSHAVVTVLIDHLPGSIRWLAVILIDLLVLFGAFLMITQGVKVVSATMMQPSPAMHVPMGYIYLAVPVSGIAIFIHKLRDLLADVGGKSAEQR